LLCGALALVPGQSAAQEEDTVPRPEAFQGRAESLVAVVEVNRDALLPGEDLFRFIALDGLTTYEPTSQTARASLFFPGNGVVSGPNLLCGTFGASFPPEFQPILDACLAYKFPLVAVADAFENDDTAAGTVALGESGDPVSGNGAKAVAHAAEDSATTDAVVQDLEVLGLPDPASLTPQLSDLALDAAVFRIDSAASRTRQEIVKGSLLVRAESTMSGVHLIGGLMEIGSLRSISTVTDDGRGNRDVAATLDISGVTVGGVPAKITDKGLVLGTPEGGGPLAQQQQAQVNELIQEIGLRVTVLPFEIDEDREGAGVASVGGLQIEFARDLSGLPALPAIPGLGSLDPNGTYTGSFVLAPTSALGLAATFPIESVPEVPVDPGTLDPGLSDGGFTDGLAAPADVVSPELPGATGSPGSPEQRALRARLLGGIFDDRIALVYLAMVFAVLGLCITPRLTLPARLPGQSS
jgi:hypothetical protein